MDILMTENAYVTLHTTLHTSHTSHTSHTHTYTHMHTHTHTHTCTHTHTYTHMHTHIHRWTVWSISYRKSMALRTNPGGMRRARGREEGRKGVTVTTMMMRRIWGQSVSYASLIHGTPSSCPADTSVSAAAVVSLWQ